MSEQKKEEPLFLEYLLIARRHAGKVFGVFAAGIVAAAAMTYYTPPTYRSRCQLLIEERRPRVTELEDFYAVGVSKDFYETQYRLIKSKALAYAVATKLKLGERSGPFRGSDPEAIGLRIWDGTRVLPVEQSRLAWVSYEGPDREKTPEILREIVQAYIEATDARHKERVDQDLAALRDELPGLRTKLWAAEEVRRKFQDEHSILSEDKTHKIMMNQLEQLNAALWTAQNARIQAELEFNQIKDAGGGFERLMAIPFIAGNAEVLALRRDLIGLEQQRMDLLRVCGPNHPDVLAVEAKTANAKERIQETTRDLAKTYESTYQSALLREKELAAIVSEKEQKARELTKVLATYEALSAEVRQIRELYDPIVKLLNETGSSSPRATTIIHVVDPAEPGPAQVGPRWTINVAVGAILGLIAGVLLAVLMEFLDDSVHGLDDLAEYAHMSVLGVIQHIAGSDSTDRRGKDMVSETAPKSAASESFRSLRTSLVLSAPPNGSVAYLVTSAAPSEGKTTVAINMAIVFAHSGRRTVLVDADLRRSGVHKAFGIDNDFGLTDCLKGEKSIENVARRSPVQGLDVITSGPGVATPSELLDSPRMGETIAELKRRYDVVIIDSPPLIAVADPLILARKVDGVLQVVHGGRTSRKVVKRASELLESVQAPVLGAVLNNVSVERDGYGYGYYRSRYYHDYYGGS